MKVNLTSKTLNEVERLYSRGEITYWNVRDYLRLWNAGPVFSQAVCLQAQAEIRTFDPEKDGHLYKHLQEEFGLRL